jgi:uncharacterized membrane protein YkoI
LKLEVSNMSTKKNLTVGLAIAALVAVMISGTALYAQQGNSTPAAATQTNNEENVQDPIYAGSISVAENTSDQSLASLAKISASDAEKAALAQFPQATVIKTELDSENGVLVFSVELNTASGVKDIKVDAGTGQILYTEAGGDVSEGPSSTEGSTEDWEEPGTPDGEESES